METRKLTVATRALLECVPRNGLATTEAHADLLEIRKMDTVFLNIAARKIVGATITMCRSEHQE